MFLCLDCLDTFDEPYIVHENEWHGEVGCYEDICYPICSNCGSENLDEIKEEEDEE